MHLYDFLDSATRALQDYFVEVEGECASATSHQLGREAVDRLTQADWLWREATALEDQARGGFDRSREMEAVAHLHFRIRLHTECFYLIAARCIDILENKWIPGIVDFRCDDIKKVRALLITHSESPNSGVTNFSWSWFEEVGPRMKPIRPAEQMGVFQDPGLFVNALALKDAVNGAVRRARERRASGR